MIEYAPLASGSKGNSILVKSHDAKILIDCGLSLKALKERLSFHNTSIEQIEAILITHEHTDHIQGLRATLGSYNIPVFCNRETALAISATLKVKISCHLFSSGETFQWKDLQITPFSISHDAIDPVGFRISCQGHDLGICADLGFVSATVVPHLKGCQLLYLEANHDEGLVMRSPRPAIYKERVLSRLGHLSNVACGKLLKELEHEHLRHVYLAHLSEDCNRAELALHTVHTELLNGQKRKSPKPSFAIDVALQHLPSALVSSQGYSN